jgi:hypothetical protein
MYSGMGRRGAESGWDRAGAGAGVDIDLESTASSSPSFIIDIASDAALQLLSSGVSASSSATRGGAANENRAFSKSAAPLKEKRPLCPRARATRLPEAAAVTMSASVATVLAVTASSWAFTSRSAVFAWVLKEYRADLRRFERATVASLPSTESAFCRDSRMGLSSASATGEKQNLADFLRPEAEDCRWEGEVIGSGAPLSLPRAPASASAEAVPAASALAGLSSPATGEKQKRAETRDGVACTGVKEKRVDCLRAEADAEAVGDMKAAEDKPVPLFSGVEGDTSVSGTAEVESVAPVIAPAGGSVLWWAKEKRPREARERAGAEDDAEVEGRETKEKRVFLFSGDMI